MANEFRVKNGLIVGNTKQMSFSGTTGKLTIGSDLTTTIDETVRDEALLHLITNNDDSDGDGVVSYDMIIERLMGDADSPNEGPVLALMSSNTDNSGSGSTDMIDDTNIGQILWRAHTDSSEANFGTIRVNIQDASNAAKDSKMFFKVQKANTITELLTLDGGNDKVVVPNSGFQIGSGATVTTIATSTSLGTSNTTLSTTGAIKSYVDSSVGAAGGGDITAVTAGDGLTGGATTGGATLTVGAGNGITVNTNDVAVTAAQTTITSVLNTGLVIGRDSTDQIKFSTDNQIIFRVGNADGVTFKASGEIEATSLDISGDADIDGTLEADAITIGGTAIAAAGTTSITTLGTIGTGTWQGTAIASAYLDADTAHLSGTQTFSGAKTFSGGINSASYGPHSTGYVILGASNDTLAITSNGAHNTHISTNSNTNSGNILIQQGANNPISITPNGTGDIQLNADTIRVGDNNADATITTRGTGDLTLSTNEGTNAGTILLADGANGDISITPNGTGQVTISAQMTSKANVVAVTGTTQLTAAQSGSYVYVTGSGAVELPDNATVGLQYTIFNNKGSDLTVTLGTNNSIVSNWATNAAVSDNEATSYVCVSAGNWVQVG